MNILITNDDGINAIGINLLSRVASEFGEVTVIAPKQQQSGCGHFTTLDKPIEMSKVGDNRFAVAGSRVDCVRIGIAHMEKKFDWVLSGINDGANLGFDIFLSGTVGAAREAAYRGLPAIAFSQYCNKHGNSKRWIRAEHHARALLKDLFLNEPRPRQFWNVNFPDLESEDAGIAQHNGKLACKIIHCELDPNPLPLVYESDGQVFSPNGDYHLRSRADGTDIDVCFSGHIAVTMV
jgi:5'-nucleotidase